MAVTVRAWAILTVQGPVPLHPSPLQPANVEPLAATAVSVTLVLNSKGALHVLPQVIPAGLEVTVPLPVPALVIVRGNCRSVKAALTLLVWSICTVHVPVPLHPSPLQPVKLEPVSVLAVNVTLVPWSKGAVIARHVLPQVIPAGLEVTVPLPVPVLVTVSVNCGTASVESGMQHIEAVSSSIP
jgi:hypothetical protein